MMQVKTVITRARSVHDADIAHAMVGHTTYFCIKSKTCHQSGKLPIISIVFAPAGKLIVKVL